MLSFLRLNQYSPSEWDTVTNVCISRVIKNIWMVIIRRRKEERWERERQSRGKRKRRRGRWGGGNRVGEGRRRGEKNICKSSRYISTPVVEHTMSQALS